MMHSTTKNIVGSLAIAATAGLAHGIDEVPVFRVHDIGQTLAPSDTSLAHGLSDDGDAVGEVWGTVRQPFVYTYEHGPVFLPLIDGYTNARALDVSARDAEGNVRIAGVCSNSFFDEVGIAAMWTYSTITNTVLEAVEIGTLPGNDESMVVAVNADGVMVGYSAGGTADPSAIIYRATTHTLEAFPFPAFLTDINDLGQVVGGTYLGDLEGSVIDLGKPDEANSAKLVAIANDGSIAASTSMPYSDGAGRRVAGAALYDDGWRMLWANSAFDYATDVNVHGDVTGAIGAGGSLGPALFVNALNTLVFVDEALEPGEPHFIGRANAINVHGQIATGFGSAVLTPLGSMIIPGDVDGNAEVDLDDLCAFMNDPVDLDDDGDVDLDDELWMLDRLDMLGFVVDDCDANGEYDWCQIAAGQDCNGNGVLDACEPDCDGDGIPDDCEADCNGNGVPDECDIAQGDSEDCNGNGIPDECDGEDTALYEHVFGDHVFLVSGETYTHEILVGGSGDIADVNVVFDIDYRIGDLIVRLSHEGETITLIDRPGYPNGSGLGNGQLGYRIVLDDEGTGPVIENVGNFGSPFEPIESPPAYRPNEALSAFDGLPVGGIWTIEIEALNFSPVSAFIRWGVEITDEAVPVDCCTPDVNGDTILDVFDVLDFLQLFEASDPAADWNDDGIFDIFDITSYLGDFSQGC